MAILNALKSLYNRPPINKAIRTFLQSFVALFATTLIPWLSDVALWANGGTGHVFPQVSVLAKGAISATVSILIGAVTFVHNQIEASTGKKLV